MDKGYFTDGRRRATVVGFSFVLFTSLYQIAEELKRRGRPGEKTEELLLRANPRRACRCSPSPRSTCASRRRRRPRVLARSPTSATSTTRPHVIQPTRMPPRRPSTSASTRSSARPSCRDHGVRSTTTASSAPTSTSSAGCARCWACASPMPRRTRPSTSSSRPSSRAPASRSASASPTI